VRSHVLTFNVQGGDGDPDRAAMVNDGILVVDVDVTAVARQAVGIGQGSVPVWSVMPARRW
jgi:hypothetical protein